MERKRTGVLKMPKTSEEIYKEYRSHIAIGQNKRNSDTRLKRKIFYTKIWFSPAEVEEAKQKAISKFAEEVLNKVNKYKCSEHRKLIKLLKSKSEMR